jgi:NAD(P)H-flavin reductase
MCFVFQNRVEKSFELTIGKGGVPFFTYKIHVIRTTIFFVILIKSIFRFSFKSVQMICKIITRKKLSENLYKLEIKPSGIFIAPKPGQYIILRAVPDGSAITLPVIKADSSREVLTVLVPSIPEKLSALVNPCSPDIQIDLEGPFGQPFQIEKFGVVLCVVNQESLIPLYPVLTALRAAGNQITCILAGASGNDQILENEIRNVSDNFINTEENSPRSSLVLGQTLRTQKYDQVFVIGSAKTIRETCNVSKATGTTTQAMLFLNEKTRKGLHGIYRVSICGNARAICVDGYNFNAYYTGFEEMVNRFGSEDSEFHALNKVPPV